MIEKFYFNLSQTGWLLVLDVVLSILHACGFNEQIFDIFLQINVLNLVIVSDPNSETKKQPETVFLIAFIMDSSEGSR